MANGRLVLLSAAEIELVESLVARKEVKTGRNAALSRKGNRFESSLIDPSAEYLTIEK